ncbi:MAG: intein-containing Rv2578c family radical SAM protein [Actinomycetota bacterium]
MTEQLFELGRKTFNTPNFRGITFIEVEAKSIINHVPGDRLPFNYTINPYRGCSHACSYCLAGDTPILMADGRTEPLADLSVGDRIYGTERQGTYRRYLTTEVLAHWSTIKPAYRITLEDGTELVCSGDHRFLTDRGWKYVTGTEQSASRRPHLTLNNSLVGTGAFAVSPIHSLDYQRGYLCGMVRGDGHLRTYSYPRPGRTKFDVHRFRLALVDLEAWQRSRSYLANHGVTTTEFIFQKAVGNYRSANAIRTSTRAGVEAIRDIICWPYESEDDWARGFLAGIFDAEGSYSRGILRIANSDSEIIERVDACLRRFAFSFATERPNRANHVMYVRLLGGMKEHLRFFHTVDPAITRKRTIEGRAIKNNARTRLVSIERLGVDIPMFDITTGTGDFIANGIVSHNCFARTTHTYMDMNAGRDFESKIVVKVNAPELLRRDLRARKWKGDHIAMGTATDPYQRAEGRYKLMPRIIETLAEFRNPFSILTKGTLIMRDLELLQEAIELADVSTAFSIGTLDDDAWARSEPGTPHPRKRIEAVRRLNDAGIPCGVMLAPILPGITDHPDQLRAVIEAAFDAGATHVSPILLHLRPGVKEEYMGWLEQNYPELVPRYMSMYHRRSYGHEKDRKALSEKVKAITASARPKLEPPPGRPRGRSRERPAQQARSEQLSLI